MPVPSHLTSVHISHPPLLCLFPDTQRACDPGYVAAAFCGYFSQADFLSARSLALAFLVYLRARPAPCAPLAPVVLLPLLRRPSSTLGLCSLHRAGSKRERSTTTNGLIFRASAFVPHDGDGDQRRRPKLEHKPAFFRRSSRMQRLTLNLESFRRQKPMQHGEGAWRHSVDNVFGVFSCE
ncbi:hypothetical protein B0H19DRAFT_1386985 [Mycena capillaripes]|nr:hypothetical protein B0H19DRAFT_1386985 [Mycena capillaripes]